MKRILFLLFLTLGFFASHAQTKASAASHIDQGAEFLKAFYTEYIKFVDAASLVDAPALLRQKCLTKKAQTQFRSYIQEADADLVLGAQAVDLESVKTLKAERKTGLSYELSYVWPSGDVIKRKIVLIAAPKTKYGYLIDSIKD